MEKVVITDRLSTVIYSLPVCVCVFHPEEWLRHSASWWMVSLTCSSQASLSQTSSNAVRPALSSMCVHITASPLLCEGSDTGHLCVKATHWGSISSVCWGSQGTWLTSWLLGCNTALSMSRSLTLPDSLVEFWFFPCSQVRKCWKCS